MEEYYFFSYLTNCNKVTWLHLQISIPSVDFPNLRMPPCFLLRGSLTNCFPQSCLNMTPTDICIETLQTALTLLSEATLESDNESLLTYIELAKDHISSGLTNIVRLPPPVPIVPVSYTHLTLPTKRIV